MALGKMQNLKKKEGGAPEAVKALKQAENAHQSRIEEQLEVEENISDQEHSKINTVVTQNQIKVRGSELNVDENDPDYVNEEIIVHGS